MRLLIKNRVEIGKEAWEQFTDSSDEAWLWHKYEFQDTLSTWRDYSDISFGLLDVDAKEELVAIMPLHALGQSQLLSLGGVASSNILTPGKKKKILIFIEKALKSYLSEYRMNEILLSLPPMSPAFCGERCPRVNPLLEIGCENRLSQTWILDLRIGKDRLWGGMEGRARTAIRKAQKNSIYIREADRDEGGVNEYYKLHCETYERTGVPPHPKQYFINIWKNFYNKGLSQIFFAENNGEIIAAENFGIYKNNAIYWTGASKQKGLELEANSLIQWTAIQWMVDRGIQWYETGESFPNIREGKLKGLNDFKKSFGGDLYPSYKGALISIENDKEFCSKRISRRQMLRSHLFDVLKSVKNLLLLLIGDKAVWIIERAIRLTCGILILPKKMNLNKFRKNIIFIKPYWQASEINIGLGKAQIDHTTSIPRLINEIKQKLQLDGTAIVPTSSGRVAIEISLKIIKSRFPERKKVIIPSYGCRGIFDPIIKNGLIPVFTDIDYNLVPDADKTMNLFNEEVLACIIVNLTGKKAETERIIASAKKYNIIIIEDNCQNTSPLESLSANQILQPDIYVYSFGIGKNIMATGGGAIASRIYREDFICEMQNLKIREVEEAKNRFNYFYNKYINEKRNVDSLSLNLDEGLFGYSLINVLDAELIILQLNNLNEIIELRKRNAATIIETLSLFPGIFYFQENEDHIYTKLSVRLKNREIWHEFIRHMAESGIELENMYIPLHKRNLSEISEFKTLQTTERIAPLIVNIPVRPNLRRHEMKRIIKAIKNFGVKYEI